MDLWKNYKGETIKHPPKLRKKKYGNGTFTKDGFPNVNWKLLKYSDSNGFDIRNIEKNK